MWCVVGWIMQSGRISDEKIASHQSDMSVALFVRPVSGWVRLAIEREAEHHVEARRAWS
jgi:hypothetical protein